MRSNSAQRHQTGSQKNGTRAFSTLMRPRLLLYVYIAVTFSSLVSIQLQNSKHQSLNSLVFFLIGSFDSLILSELKYNDYEEAKNEYKQCTNHSPAYRLYVSLESVFVLPVDKYLESQSLFCCWQISQLKVTICLFVGR